MLALELVRRAIMRLSAGQPEPSMWLDREAEVSALIPEALEKLATDVARDYNKSGLMLQNYSVTLTSGDAALLTVNGVITSAPDILWWSIPYSEVLDTATNKRLIYMPNKYDFEGYVMPGFYYYTLAGQRIYTRGSTIGNYHDYDKYEVIGPLTVTANFIPSVSTLPSILDDDAVTVLAEMAALKLIPEKSE